MALLNGEWGRSSPPEYLLPVVVVPGPLLRVGQHVVRLLDQLETLLRSLRIIRVLVRVVLRS